MPSYASSHPLQRRTGQVPSGTWQAIWLQEKIEFVLYDSQEEGVSSSALTLIHIARPEGELKPGESDLRDALFQRVDRILEDLRESGEEIPDDLEIEHVSLSRESGEIFIPRDPAAKIAGVKEVSLAKMAERNKIEFTKVHGKARLYSLQSLVDYRLHGHKKPGPRPNLE